MMYEIENCKKVSIDNDKCVGKPHDLIGYWGKIVVNDGVEHKEFIGPYSWEEMIDVDDTYRHIFRSNLDGENDYDMVNKPKNKHMKLLVWVTVLGGSLIFWLGVFYYLTWGK